MKKKVSAILFDKDGTLIEIEKVWDPYYLSVIQELAKISTNTIQQIANSCGFRLLNNQSSKDSILCLGSPDEIIQHWSNTSNIPYQTVKEIAETLYQNIDYNHPVIYNIKEVMEQISQRVSFLGVATMDNTDISRKTIESLGIHKMILYHYGTDVYDKKPSPHMVQAFSHDIQTDTSEIMVVGDSMFDMQMARNANAIGVGVLTGSANRQQLIKSGAFTVIGDISYLPNLLQELNEK